MSARTSDKEPLSLIGLRNILKGIELPDVQKLQKSNFGKDLAGFQLSLWQQGQLLRRQRGEQSVDRSSEAGDNSIH